MLKLLYNIRGVVSRNVIQCYIGWGVVKNFQFLRYISYKKKYHDDYYDEA